MYADGKSVVYQEGEEPLTDFSSLPMANFDDFDLSLYQTNNVLSVNCNLPIVASNGCNRSCTFCTYRHYMGKFQLRSARSVFEEMKHHKYAYGTCSFSFNDGMINADSGFLEELCDLIVESGEVFSWGGNFGFKEDVKHSLIQKMAKAGCNNLMIGLESGSEKVRRDMLKPCSNETVVKLLKALYDAGIRHHTINFIVGYPTEGIEEFEETLTFIKTNHQYMWRVYVNPCHVLEGTILSKIAKDEGFEGTDPLNWSWKDNNPKERERRVKIANDLAKSLDLVKSSISGDF
jgi:radical SAM superfamily enzyme YgiQ (UPF0313 family)